MKKTLILFTMVLAAAFVAGKACGQPILTTLVSFDAGATNENNLFTNTFGVNPRGTLALGSDGSFYGTTYSGGIAGVGGVFKVTTNGVLTAVASLNFTGAQPYGGLIFGNDGNLYGTTDDALGTMFQVTTNGILTSIPSPDGLSARHQNSLAQDAQGALYGVSQYGGVNTHGALFKISTDGTVFWAMTLADDIQFNEQSISTNANGGNPWAGLTLGNDGNFYGTTSVYGANGHGTVFRVTTNGDFTTLAAFDAWNYDGVSQNTNASGASPYAGLTLGRDGIFYGTTFLGGTNGNGTVFKVTTNGVLTGLTSFAADSMNSSGVFTNATGANPWAGLTMGIDGSLFGTTDFGGTSGNGTIFQVTTNGAMTWLFSFPAGYTNSSGALTNLNGIQPNALTLGNDGNLYGTTRYGGRNGNGTVFRINLNPLRILVNYPTFGVKTNQFGFSIIGTNGLVVVVETCTNLANPVWSPVGTNTINGVLSFFSDPRWTNSPNRFYRFRAP